MWCWVWLITFLFSWSFSIKISAGLVHQVSAGSSAVCWNMKYLLVHWVSCSVSVRHMISTYPPKGKEDRRIGSPCSAVVFWRGGVSTFKTCVSVVKLHYSGTLTVSGDDLFLLAPPMLRFESYKHVHCYLLSFRQQAPPETKGRPELWQTTEHRLNQSRLKVFQSSISPISKWKGAGKLDL